MPPLIGQPLDALDTPQLAARPRRRRRQPAAHVRRRQGARRQRAHPFQIAQVRRPGAYIKERGGATLPVRQAQRSRGAGRRRHQRYPHRQPDRRPAKVARLANLAKRVQLRVCVDQADNVDQLQRSAAAERPARRSASSSRSTSAWPAAASPPGEAAVAVGAAHPQEPRPALRRPARLRRPSATHRRRRANAGRSVCKAWNNSSARGG